MQKIIGALVLVYSTLALSQSIPPTQQPSQPWYSTYGVGINPANTCISDICRVPAQSNLHATKYLDRIVEYMVAASASNQQIYPPEIVKLFAELQATTAKQNQALAQTFRESSGLGNSKPDGIARAMHNLMAVSPHLSKLKYKVDTTGGKSELKIDEQASVNALKDLPAEERDWVLKFGGYIAATSSSGDLSDGEVESEPPTLLLKKRHPGKSVKDSLYAEISEAQAAIAKLKNLSPLEKAVYFNRVSPERIAQISSLIEDGSISENESRELIRWNVEHKRIKSWFASPDSPLLTREPPPVETLIQERGGVEAIAKAFEAQQIKNQNKDREEFEACKELYFLNKGLLPNNEQIETLNRDIRRSKDLVIELIKGRFPATMHAKLIRAVEDTTFIAPPTAARFEQDFTTNLRRELEAQRAHTEVLKTLPAKDVRKTMAALAQDKPDGDQNESNAGVNRFCAAFTYSPFSDANYTTLGSIIVSFSTARAEEASRLMVIMHELGHTISKTIADNPRDADRFYGLRKCLADQHSEEMPPATKKWMEELRASQPNAQGPYVEEDFADSIAGEAGRGLKGRNPWCPFMTLSYDRQQYADSSIQAADGDLHSSSIFRLLRFETMKNGGLPESCRLFLDAAKFSGRFNACFDSGPAQSNSPNLSEQ